LQGVPLLVIVNVSSFEFHHMMSGPNSSNFSPLDYRIWGQCWSLITAATEAKNSSEFIDARHFIWSALPYWKKPLKTLWKSTTS